MSSASDPNAGQCSADGAAPDSTDSQVTDSQVTDPKVTHLGIDAAHRAHWGRNMRLTIALLVVWAVVGLGCGVLFADALNEFTFLGFPLGFWFAQQGAIVTFVVLILVYALGMARLDRKLERELQRIASEEGAQ